MACVYLFSLIPRLAWAWAGLGMRLIHFLLLGLYIQSWSNVWLLSYSVLILQVILAWYQFCMKITLLLLLAMWVQIDGSSIFIFILCCCIVSTATQICVCVCVVLWDQYTFSRVTGTIFFCVYSKQGMEYCLVLWPMLFKGWVITKVAQNPVFSKLTNLESKLSCRLLCFCQQFAIC